MPCFWKGGEKKKEKGKGEDTHIQLPLFIYSYYLLTISISNYSQFLKAMNIFVTSKISAV